MKEFHGIVNVGLREKETDRLIAVYPEALDGEIGDIEDKVKFWYYQQSCSAEDQLRDCFVDVLTENELIQYNGSRGCTIPGSNCDSFREE